MKLCPELIAAVENVVKQIQEYESDTFSASESEVTEDLAQLMAVQLIFNHLFDVDGMPGDSIDGAVIGYAYDAVTEENDD